MNNGFRHLCPGTTMSVRILGPTIIRMRNTHGTNTLCVITNDMALGSLASIRTIPAILKTTINRRMAHSDHHPAMMHIVNWTRFPTTETDPSALMGIGRGIGIGLEDLVILETATTGKESEINLMMAMETIEIDQRIDHPPTVTETGVGKGGKTGNDSKTEAGQTPGGVAAMTGFKTAAMADLHGIRIGRAGKAT